jgi:hypothetical protein
MLAPMVEPMRPLSLILLLQACAPAGDPDAGVPLGQVAPPEPQLRRLTASQLKHTLADLLGDDVVLPPPPDPDAPLAGFASVGAGLTTLSPRGAERWEEASYMLAKQALSPERSGRVVPCTPDSDVDEACATAFIRAFGRRAWRRPLSEQEVQGWLSRFRAAAVVTEDFYEALAYPMSGLLQSPNFLFRVELGEEDGDQRRFNAYELATRLSYLLWDGPPDDALLTAAGTGALDSDEGLAAVVDEMLDDPRFSRGLRAFFTERLRLADLDHLTKDTTVFVHMSPEVGALAREETLRTIEEIVLGDHDLRDLITADFTWLDRRLAAIYDVSAPSFDGFDRVALDPSRGRVGLLGQVSFLALQAHPTSTSATRRGKFIRETLLCETVLPPPAGVNTAIPEPSAGAQTLRDRIAVHLESPGCAICHKVMDPIGLGLERFDGIGRARTFEGGAEIDPSGVLDGLPFRDAVELALAIRNHPDHAPCVARHLYRYATGHVEVEGEQDQVDALANDFESASFRLMPLYRAVATSPGFRTAGPFAPERLDEESP